MHVTSVIDTAHVCQCGHFRVFHSPACRDCDCDAFSEGKAPRLGEPRHVEEKPLFFQDATDERETAERTKSEKRRGALVRRPAPSFEAAVRRMRRAQSKARTEKSRRAVDLAFSAEREVDTMLEKLVDEEPELAALETAPLFATIPAWSEYLRRNPKEAFKEAERIAREERKLSKQRGCDDHLAHERGERAKHAFLARSRK